MKINLLPGRVGDKSTLKAMWVLVALLIAVELAGLIFFQTSLRAQENRLAEDVKTKEAEAQQVQKLEQEASAERAKVRDIDQKVKFVKDLTEYNGVRPDLYMRTAEYTLQGIRYTT